MLQRKQICISCVLIFFLFVGYINVWANNPKTPVDYVDPYVGNISHLLVPTYPTIHLPNSMLRVYPDRESFTGNRINGLPIIVTTHRESSAFGISPFQGDVKDIKSSISYSYDNEIIKPYFYSVYLDENEVAINYAPSHQAGLYNIEFKKTHGNPFLILKTGNGELFTDGQAVWGRQSIDNRGGKGTSVYVYLETDAKAVRIGAHEGDKINTTKKIIEGRNAYYVMEFPKTANNIGIRYGVSFISTDQAKKNLKREIPHYSVETLAAKGKKVWNDTLGKISVSGADEDAKTVFYTSFYRICERMINISEDGRYFSAFDGQVHNDEGTAFYTDDWIWDTYLAAHPLRTILFPDTESAMIKSYLRMSSQMPRPWMPNFPEVNGDSRRMNCNHGVAMVLDAYNKGLRGFDLEEAYIASKGAITEKTLAPWSSKPAGVLDQFYKDHGYYPSLAPDEIETVPEVHGWEKRQPVPVTLGSVYDEWCLGQIAEHLGKNEEAKFYIDRGLNYRKIFNPETKFFHPKDTFGIFMPNLDYRFPPGIGGRDAYDENTGYIFRFNVQHNIADLVELLGGKKAFVEALEDMYSTPLGKGRPDFYHIYADHTGNVGQFSMGNEPAMHIPYLYNYAGEPWRTQKRVRSLLKQWFRNDLMGVPGDEDGGGLTAFAVFSHLGFYPMTPGMPMYVIGAPVFERASLQLPNGKVFEVVCQNYDPNHKYIQSAKLNGKEWNKSWFTHNEMMNGGVLEFVMGKYPNKSWAADASAIPPSFRME